MKKGRIAKVQKISFEDRLLKLKEELILLDSIAHLHNYFKHCKLHKNSYIVELRRIVALELIVKGISYSEIGRILSRDHSSILSLLHLDSHTSVHLEVKANYLEWIEKGLYPITYTKRVPSADHKDGWKSIVMYELKELKDDEKGKNTKRSYFRGSKE
jgi:hypothetical protein